MPLKIVTADERLNQRDRAINIAIFGEPKIGKTTLARTLDPETTLFIDLEAGTLSLEEWRGTVIDILQSSRDMAGDPWEIAKAITCWLCGPNPMAPAASFYSADMYQKLCASFGDPAQFAGKSTLFWDSITVASRLAYAYADRHPESISEKSGKKDGFAVYRILGQELIGWLTHIQHAQNRTNIVVGILEQHKTPTGLTVWEPQIEGSKAGRELPGIFDHIVTLAMLQTPEGKSYRALVCTKDNPWGFPAGGRSGRLDMLEPPDLGALLTKIRTAKRHDTTLGTALPAPEQPNAAPAVPGTPLPASQAA